MINFEFDINNIPDYTKSIGDAYDEVYEEIHLTKD